MPERDPPIAGPSERRARTSTKRNLQLDREESRVKTAARQASEAETDVRLTGLVPRLTSPSRHNSHLVDLWFGVERHHRTAEWDEAFIRVAEGWRPDPKQASYFWLFSHPSSAALVVTRQVSADPDAWHDIELEAQALVARVNRAVADQRAGAASPPSKGRQQGAPGVAADVPILGWLSEAAQAIRGLVPKPTIPVSQSSSTGAR